MGDMEPITLEAQSAVAPYEQVREQIRAQVSAGPCNLYLLRLQSANGAGSSNARYLLPQLYEPGGVRARRHIVSQIALTARMLHRAARAAPRDVCAPAVGGPAT